MESSNNQLINDLSIHDSLLSVSQLMSRLNIGKTAVYTLIKQGDLPKPVKIGGSARWFPQEIVAYLEAMKAKRDEPRPTRRGRPRKVLADHV